MKKAKLIENITFVNDLSDFDRLYIGNDYCENNISLNNIIRLIEVYQNKNITLLLPFLTDYGLNKLERILNLLKSYKLKNFEIVFNDWGTFYYLRKYYPNVKLILGRLLTKQRKDPRINIILQNKQDRFKVFKSFSESKIVYTKKSPKTLLKLFSGNYIETSEILDFLIKNNTSRIEVDNLVWDMIFNLPKNIKVSMYYPYILLNVTRYCGAINGKYEKICNKDCLRKSKNISENIFLKGNSLYYRNNIMPKKKILKSNNIDRIVYQDI